LDSGVGKFLRIEVPRLSQAEKDVSEGQARSFNGLSAGTDLWRNTYPSVVQGLPT